MSDHAEHNPLDHEDPLPGPTWIIGILGTVLLAVVVMGVTALFFNADSRMVDEKVMTSTYPEYEALKAAQIANIESPARFVEVNENERIALNLVIPIDQAMAKMAAAGGVIASEAPQP